MSIKWTKSQEWLEHQYIALGKTMLDIANEFGLKWHTVRGWMLEYDIPRRNRGFNNLGKKFTAEHKEKIRQSMLGRTSPMKGRKMTEEHKRKIGDAQRGKKSRLYGQRGVLCHNWKGGITKKNHILRTRREYEDWRKAVLERDGYACVNCLDYPEHPHVHHIIPFIDCPDELYEKSNGATLCGECHRHIHMTEY